MKLIIILERILCDRNDYLVPEILKGKGYEKVVDWFSLVSVIFEMLTGFLLLKKKKFKFSNL